MAKDLFSGHAELYAQARPTYPQSVADYIAAYCLQRSEVWDCAAGSGQFTQCLAPLFERVEATDISLQQLNQAPRMANVHYQVMPAEHTSFADQQFDLITVAQAIHWFDFDAFYAEAQRVLKPAGVLAVMGYALIEVADGALNHCIQQLYTQTLKPYWDAERKYIDQHYQTIPFPLKEIYISDADKAQMALCYTWSIQQLYDYLTTWSAVQHYQKQVGENPLDVLNPWLALNQSYIVNFPLLLRLGHFA